MVDAGALGVLLGLMEFSDCNVTSQADYCALCYTVTEIVVDDCCCNEDSFDKLDFSRFGNVERIHIGSYSFRNVLSFTIHRLPRLKEIIVGCDSFTSRQKTGNVFCVKKCKGLKELKIGRGSFSKYSVCEITKLDELEVIEMGTLEAGGPFSSASLKLKSAHFFTALMNRPAEGENPVVWNRSLLLLYSVCDGEWFLLPRIKHRPARIDFHSFWLEYLFFQE